MNVTFYERLACFLCSYGKESDSGWTISFLVEFMLAEVGTSRVSFSFSFRR